MDEPAEWCNSFILEPKPNGKVRLCLDAAWVNQELTRQVHEGPTLNDIFPKLNNVKYLSLIDANSGYHSLTLDERSLCLTTFACQFGRYRDKILLSEATSAGGMFQWKTYEIFKDLPNAFGIANDILVVGFDSNDMDHDQMLQKVLQICRQAYLKLNKYKCHFRCTSVPFFGDVISRHGVRPDPKMLKVLMEMPPPRTKKELQTFLWIINYLCKFFPSTADICKSLGKLMSAKTEWTWNATCQKIFDKAKSIIKKCRHAILW